MRRAAFRGHNDQSRHEHEAAHAAGRGPEEPPRAPPVIEQGVEPGATWAPKSSICLQLEQRLVQESQRGNQSRDLVPMVETEVRQVEQALRSAQAQLERMDR